MKLIGVGSVINGAYPVYLYDFYQASWFQQFVSLISTKMEEYKEIVENRNARISYQRMRLRALKGKR